MNIFVAGASGAIGRPLITELIRRSHMVTGMTRSEVGARHLAALGAAVAQVSSFDAPALGRAFQESRAEVVIDELSSVAPAPVGNGRRRGRRPAVAPRRRREPPPRRAGVRRGAGY